MVIYPSGVTTRDLVSALSIKALFHSWAKHVPPREAHGEGLGYLLEERGHGLALGGRDALHPVWRLHADDLWGKEDSPR